MQSLAEQIIIDIIANEMAIDPARNIWVRDQNRKIPNDDGLYIIVGMVDSIFMSSQTYLRQQATPPPVTQYEVNEVALSENIQIDILSRSQAAILRRWEVIAALRSIYSQQKQEENSFKIFRQPRSFINASLPEGGSQLNRFALSFPCFVWYRKEKALSPTGNQYFDNFETRVDDEKTIGTPEGIFKFTITPED